MLNHDDGEEWVETKSIAGPFLENWFVQKLEGKAESNPIFNSDEDRSYFRQFFHDMRLNEKFINGERQGQILDIDRGGVVNHKYTWHFQEFKTNTSSKSPRAEDEKRQEMSSVNLR